MKIESQYTPAQLNRFGDNLAEILYMKKDKEHPDRWQTNWGAKTGLGLMKTIIRVVKELENGKPDDDIKFGC